MSNILEVKNLSKKYHTLEGEIEAISDVSFNLKDKEEDMFKSYIKPKYSDGFKKLNK